MEFRGGVRTEGVIFGMVTFAQKTALGLGIGALGVLLDFIGYRPNEIQSADTLENIRFLFTLVPAGFAFAAGLLIAFYPRGSFSRCSSRSSKGLPATWRRPRRLAMPRKAKSVDDARLRGAKKLGGSDRVGLAAQLLAVRRQNIWRRCRRRLAE